MNGVGEEHIVQVWYDEEEDDLDIAIHHPDSCPRVLAREKWGDEWVEGSGWHPDTLVVDCIVVWQIENVGFLDSFPDLVIHKQGMHLYHATLTPYRCGSWDEPEWDVDTQVWPFSRWERFVWWIEHRLGWDAR